LKDAGAYEVGDFVDGGLANTLEGKHVQEAAGVLLNYLTSLSPDVIVVELGGGVVLGANIILDYAELKGYFSAVVVSAEEVTAAFGAVEALKRFHNLSTDAIGGPAANSQYFRHVVKHVTGISAYDFRNRDQAHLFLQTIMTRLGRT
jgi:hypothetical protein